MPVSIPMSSSMCTRSSVTTLPVAPGAYGQPPSPPIDASNRAHARGRARRARSRAPVPRVLWKCSPTLAPAMPARSSVVEQRRRPGAASPCRSCRRTRAGRRPRRADGRATCATRVRRDVALVGTAERGRDDRRRPAVPASCAIAMSALRAVERLRRPTGARSCGCGSRYALTTTSTSSAAGRDRPLGAPLVRDQRRVDDARDAG